MGNLAAGINHLGGARYTLGRLTTANSTYTLVAPGLPSNGPAVRFPFDNKVVTSSSSYSDQGQTGAVAGVLARGLNGSYAPLTASQVDGLGNGKNATAVTPGFSFYLISSQTTTAWPLADTPGHLAAYHFLSQSFMKTEYNETGSHSADLRYFYTDTTKSVGDYNTMFDCKQIPNPCPSYPTDGTAQFTQSELNDATTALYQELTAYKMREDTWGRTVFGVC